MRQRNNFPVIKEKKILIRAAAWFLAPLLAFWLSACINEPVAPVWDVEVNVPVANKSYSLMDVLKKDTKNTLTYDADSKNISYVDNKPLKTIVVEDKIRLNPLATGVQFPIPSISITPSPFSTTVSISQFGSGFSTKPPVPIPVGYISTSISKDISGISGYDTVALASGKIAVTISNNTTYNLSIIIKYLRLSNASGGSSIFSINDSVVVAPKSSYVTVQDVAGKTISNSLTAQIGLATLPVSSTMIDPAETIGFGFEFRNLDPARVRAKVPDQAPFSKDSSFTLDQSSKIQTVEVSRGKLTYVVTNNFQTSITASFKIPDLYTPANVSYSNSFTLPKNSSQAFTLPDLSGYAIKAPSGSPTSTLRFSLTTKVEATSSSIVLAKSDNVGVDVNMDTLVLKKVSGIIKPTPLTLKSTAIPIYLGTLSNFNAGEIHFKNFSLNLRLATSAQTKLRLENATIRGKNSTQSATISVPATILEPGGALQKVTLNSTDLDAFINTFLNKPPDSLIFNYNVTVNPDGSSISITNADSVFGYADINVPLNVGIKSGTITDTTEIDMASANRRELDNILSAGIVLTVSNGLPAKLNFSGTLRDETGAQLLNIPPSPNPDLTIEAAPVDASGNVTAAKETKLNIKLTGDDIRKFINSKKMIYTMAFSTTGETGVPVMFKTTDAIKVYAAGKLVYKTNP